MRHPCRRYGRMTTFLAAVLGFALLGACGGSFLDDFPPYPPTETYLEEQEVMELRLRALAEERARNEAEYWEQRWARSEVDWRRMDALLDQGELARDHRDRLRAQGTAGSAEDIAAWQAMEERRIAGELERRRREENRRRSGPTTGGDRAAEWEEIMR